MSAQTGYTEHFQHAGGFLYRPFQFLNDKDKDFEWHARNIDWLEWQGLRQLQLRSYRLLKNYKLIAGIIDRTDYDTNPEVNEDADLINTLSEDDYKVIDLKFFPIIPIVINTLLTEFNKRKQEVIYKAIDEYSTNEFLESKKKSIEQVFIQEVQKRMLLQMASMGAVDPNDPEVQKMLSEDNIRKLPELEKFFTKNFRLNIEDLAEKFHKIDEERFNLKELEFEAVKDFLTTSTEIWRFNLMEEDYNIELWSPLLTFYRLNPNSKYISDGEYVGMTTLMNVSEVIDKFGKYMSDEDKKMLESVYPATGARYAQDGIDQSMRVDWNNPIMNDVLKTGGMDFKRLMYWNDTIFSLGDVVSALVYNSEAGRYTNNFGHVRVTTVYWKSVKKVGILTKIDEQGNKTQEIVDDTYKPMVKPIYNKSLYKEESERTLVYGEHIEWEWVNEVRGGIKIGPNIPNFYNFNPGKGGFKPIYIGINDKVPGPIRYQIRSSDNIYDCKLPVEGIVLYERGVKSHSPVDLMKPFQISYNVVNNQIMDMLLDEIGSVVLLDENVLPENSLDGEWGNDKFAKAYMAMKKFGILPINTSASNIGGRIDFNHYQVMNLEHTSRLQTRVQLAQYFKQQCLEVIGITPERIGRPVSEYASARNVEMSVVNSYSVTEKFFIYHSDFLMKRIHEMRTNILLMYLADGKLNKTYLYLTKDYEREIIKVNEDDLYLRDIGVFCTTNYNFRFMIEQLRTLIIGNPNLGASLTDIADIMEASTYSQVKDALNKINQRQQEQAMAQQQAEQAKLQQQIALLEKEKELSYNYQKQLEELKGQYRLMEAKIRSSFLLAKEDINQNKQSDYLDFIEGIDQDKNANIKREEVSTRKELNDKKLQLEQEKIRTRKEEIDKRLQHEREMKEMDYRIAQEYEKENKNKKQE